jgi:EpsD family peptidyl-prolyl cis-trans isomerase
MKTRLILAGLLAFALAGCGKHTSENKHSQIAAKVNGHDITVLEVNSVLSHMGKVSTAQSQTIADSVVKNLVDQELLSQQAIKKKLDRNPQVLETILLARKQILAQAYMASRLRGVSLPSNTAILDFYNKHPDLFARRAIYQTEDILIQGGASKTAAIRKAITVTKTPAAFIGWLKTQHLPFHVGINVQAAEQLPFPTLKQLYKMKRGQTIMGQDGGNLLVMVLLHKQEQPRTLAQAREAIKGFLLNKEREKIATRTLRRLSAAAKIEYFGAYANAGKAKVLAPTSPGKGVPVKPGASHGANRSETLQKGISGLN